MGFEKVAVCAALLAFGPSVVQAQTFPPNALIGGGTKLSVAGTSFGGSCYVDRGFSGFQRNNADPLAVISFSTLVDSKVWDLSGVAVMTFTSSTAGNILFKNTAGSPPYPPNVRNPLFSNFSQSFVNGQLTVTFDISFPDCTLHILGAYTP